MQFTVAGFQNSNNNTPPTNPVNGMITWQAASVGAPIQSFDSISLNLGGHNYTVNELGFYRFDVQGWDMIGGLVNDVGSVGNLTDDFWLRWNRNPLSGFDFVYASSQRSGIWDSLSPASFTSFSITAVPEPTMLSLLMVGLLGVGVRRCRHQ